LSPAWRSGAACWQIHTTADIYAHVRLRLQRGAIESMGQALESTSDSDELDRDTDDTPDVGED
jgi:hypothetical protein